MKSADIFPSKYLRAADLAGKEPVVIIDRVEMEEVGDGMKPVVYFVGKERGIVLNKTNWTTIEEISGSDDSDHWTGVRIKLIVVKVEYQGKRVPGIRIETPPDIPKKGELARAVAAARKMPQPPADNLDEPVDAPADDEIPF